MKATVTKNALLFIIFALLTFISSCNPDLYEFPQKDIASQNEIATQLLSLMSDQKGSYMRFQEKLGPHKPLYDYVQTGNSTDFGLYYAIPYLDEKDSLSGCIVYPIDENCDEEVRSYKGILGNPINLNQDYLENKIPITRRFLYSSRFLQWKNKYQQNSSKTLSLFAENLKEKTIIIQNETPTARMLRSTTTSAANGAIVFYFDYMSYTGIPDGAAYALSPTTLNEMIYRQCILYLPIQYLQTDRLLNSSVTATMTLKPNNHLDDSKINQLIFKIAQEIIYAAWRSNFRISMQFNYYFTYTSSAGSSNWATGGADYSSIVNYVDPNRPSEKDKDKAKPPFEDCKENKADSICKSSTKNIISLIKNAPTDATYKKYSDYQTFLSKVYSDNVEYSISFEQYPGTDGQSIDNRITSPIRGEQYKVTNTLDSYTTATIHNHINGTPPSITDLFYTANLPNTAPQCKTTYIYNQQDSTFYALQIINSDKAKQFYTKYKDELDENTNDYKIHGEFSYFISSKNFGCSPSELQLYKLVSILDNFDAGIALIKIDKRNNAISYSATPQFKSNYDMKKSLKLTYCRN